MPYRNLYRIWFANLLFTKLVTSRTDSTTSCSAKRCTLLHQPNLKEGKKLK